MARPRLAVVDASVVAKWFLEVPDTEAARVLRREHIEGGTHLAAPDFIVFEVANALRYVPSAGSDLVAEHAEALIGMEMGLDPGSELSVREAVRETFRTGLTVYDAAYIALARRLDCLLYTADETQLRAAGPLGRHVLTLQGDASR